MQSGVNHLEKHVSSALRGFATFLAVRPPSSTYHELEIAWETILEGHGKRELNKLATII